MCCHVPEDTYREDSGGSVLLSVNTVGEQTYLCNLLPVETDTTSLYILNHSVHMMHLCLKIEIKIKAKIRCL